MPNPHVTDVRPCLVVVFSGNARDENHNRHISETGSLGQWVSGSVGEWVSESFSRDTGQTVGKYRQGLFTHSYDKCSSGLGQIVVRLRSIGSLEDKCSEAYNFLNTIRGHGSEVCSYLRSVFFRKTEFFSSQF